MLGAKHGHARAKTRWLRDLPDIDLVGIYEPSLEFRADRGETVEYQHITWIDDIDSILSDDTIKGIVIGGAEVENPSYARRSLAAGKHVLMEKACGWTKAHATELIGTAEQNSLLFQVGYNFRPMPPFRRVIDMVRAGDFGTVHLVRAHMGSPFSADVLPRQLGGPYFRGGAFYNLGCHALDMVMAVTGTPNAVHPFRRQVRAESQAQDYYDLHVVVLEYPETLASIELSFLETENRRPRAFEVYGSDAQAIVTPFMLVGDKVPSAAIHTGGPDAGANGWHTYGSDAFEPFRTDIEDFAACIRGESVPHVNYAHDLAVHHTLMDICGESDVEEMHS
jgi:predicted dehydrogenase